MLRNIHSDSSVSFDANWSYGYQDHSLNQKNVCNSFRYSNCTSCYKELKFPIPHFLLWKVCGDGNSDCGYLVHLFVHASFTLFAPPSVLPTLLPFLRPSLSSVHPSFQPALTPSVLPTLYSPVQLSNLSSLPPSISPPILLTFPCSVLQYVGPSFRPSFRAPGDSLRARDPPYLPRSVGPFFYTVGLSLGWLDLLTWGTRKGSTTRLFTAMTWRSPSNAYSDREGSSWNTSTEPHKNKFSMHSFPYATIRTSWEYN